MKDKQKEIIERIKALRPELSDKSLNEMLEGIAGNSNHTITLEITQPQFTLTPEEIDKLTPVFDRLMDARLYDFVSFLPDDLPLDLINNLLNRIKQWQDENNN